MKRESHHFFILMKDLRLKISTATVKPTAIKNVVFAINRVVIKKVALRDK